MLNVPMSLRVFAKTTHLFFIIVLFAAGLGLMLRSYTEQKKKGKE